MTETLATRKPLTGYHLKLIALATMILDHTTAALFPQFWFLRGIGRMAFPIYAFLIAEGCRYTRDRFQYAMRLGLFALISEIPYDLALHPDILEQSGWGWNFVGRTNVFYTMFFAVSAIYIFETLRRQPRKGQLAGILVALVYSFAFSPLNLMISAGVATWTQVWPVMRGLHVIYTPALLLVCRWLEKRSGKDKWAKPGWGSNLLALLPLIFLSFLPGNLTTDYGTLGFALICFIYLAKNRRWQCGILAVGMLYQYAWPPARAIFLQGSTTINIPYVLARVFFALLSAALIYFAYNGQRGKKAKWGFYAAYPAHLAILAAIRAVLKV